MIERHRARGPGFGKKGHFRNALTDRGIAQNNRLEEVYKWILYLDV